MTQFSEFNLDDTILQAIERLGYKEPTPIQSATLPVIQSGKDIIALAQTGSGKTAACTIPICNRVNVHKKDIQALIIVPTRELALQYATEAQKIGKERQVKAFAMYGGESDTLQETKIRDGVQVLIATPGRLIDFIYSRRINLTQVATLVLDEADEMLSMGFYDDLEFIIQCLNHAHQTLLFSATMPPKIRIMAKAHMIDPVEISLIDQRAGPKNIDHQFVYCLPHEREDKLLIMLKEFTPKQSIIFANSRNQCEKIQKNLQRSLPGVDFLHGGLSQDLRTTITSKFRMGKIKHLVATDVAARGLDFSGISHVFIFQLSPDPDIYIHRSGRTGRVDRKGIVTTFITKYEVKLLQNLLNRIKCEPKWIGQVPNLSGGEPARTGRPPNGKGAPRSKPRASKPYNTADKTLPNT